MNRSPSPNRTRDQENGSTLQSVLSDYAQNDYDVNYNANYKPVSNLQEQLIRSSLDSLLILKKESHDTNIDIQDVYNLENSRESQREYYGNASAMANFQRPTL